MPDTRPSSSRLTVPGRSIRSIWTAQPTCRKMRGGCPRPCLQPFVPGEPMSASFLVSPEGRAWLIGIGRQRMEIRDGRFEYRGGEIPARCPGAVEQVRRAVDAVEGLRGFVGSRFHLGRASAACHHSRDQPAPDDVTRRALPAVAGGPPGPGLARGILDRRLETTTLLEGLVWRWCIPETAVVFDADGEFAGR